MEKGPFPVFEALSIFSENSPKTRHGFFAFVEHGGLLFMMFHDILMTVIE